MHPADPRPLNCRAIAALKVRIDGGQASRVLPRALHHGGLLTGATPLAGGAEACCGPFSVWDHAPVEGPADVAEGDLGQLGDDAVDRDAGLGRRGADQLVNSGLDLVRVSHGPAARGVSAGGRGGLRGAGELQDALQCERLADVEPPDDDIGGLRSRQTDERPERLASHNFTD
jgi:hypothetical protein